MQENPNNQPYYEEESEIDIMELISKLWKNRSMIIKWCISGAIIVVALIMQFVGAGLNLGIDFTGGSILNYSVGEDYDVNDVEAILNASGYTDNQITKAAPSAASRALQAEIAAAAEAEAAKAAEEAANAPHVPTSEELLAEIRDLLKNK